MSANQGTGQDDLYRWADQIPAALWDDLRARPAAGAAEAVGARLVDGLFTVPLLGTTYTVDPRARTIRRTAEPEHRVGYQTAVVLLTALAHSKGVPPSERMVTPLELEGGTEFFTGAHSLALKPLARRFGGDPRQLVAAARPLGGEEVTGADCAVRIPGLPLLPLHALVWAANREFEARAVIGIDSRALFHLDLSGVFALTNLMVARLVCER
jgi:hypothetical protein